VPYPGTCIPYAPTRIAALRSSSESKYRPLPTSARARKIGCGDGGNRSRSPTPCPSHCVGIDLAATAIERGRNSAALRSRTATRRRGSCHCRPIARPNSITSSPTGVFGGLPGRRYRDALLPLISDDYAERRRLRQLQRLPWLAHRRHGARDAALSHARIDDPGERVEQAKALLRFRCGGSRR